MEDTLSINDLQHPSWNPRKISDFDFNNLVQLIKEFGDLSGVVRNVATGNIVGGNQRVEAFKKLNTDQIIITQRMNEPTRTGTVAHGYVVLPDGERFNYRETMWPVDATDSNGVSYSSKERAANIGANRVTGEWDKDLLAQIDYELSQLDNGADLLALSGQTEDEINQLLASVSGDPLLELEDEKPEKADDGLQRTKFKFTQDQYDVIYQAIAQMKHDRAVNNGPSPDADSNALWYICQSYLQNAMSHNIANTAQTYENSTSPTEPSSTVQATAETVDFTPTVQATFPQTPPAQESYTYTSTPSYPDDLTSIPSA